MADLRILVAGASPLARAGLVALLNQHPNLSIVGSLPWGTELIDGLDVFRPDVVVGDLGWDPALAMSTLDDMGSEPPTLALLTDELQVGLALAAGVRGLLPQTISTERLVAALQAVASGWLVVDPAFARGLPLPTVDAAAAPADTLTPRELEVLQLIAEGLANKTIALQLNISEHTVKFHVNAILSKLSAQSRTEAVVRATRLGLIAL